MLILCGRLLSGHKSSLFLFLYPFALECTALVMKSWNRFPHSAPRGWHRALSGQQNAADLRAPYLRCVCFEFLPALPCGSCSHGSCPPSTWTSLGHPEEAQSFPITRLQPANPLKWSCLANRQPAADTPLNPVRTTDPQNRELNKLQPLKPVNFIGFLKPKIRLSWYKCLLKTPSKYV